MPDNLPPVKLGIIAGRGELPLALAAACIEANRPFFVLGLKGFADPARYRGMPQGFIRLGAGAEGLRLLRQNGVEALVMGGGVQRPSLLSLRPDWRAMVLFARIGYRALGDDGLLKAVIAELEGEGFRVLGIEDVLPDCLAPAGSLGSATPDEQAEADIAQGLSILKVLGPLDIGQAVVVQQGLVLGIEAIEGTDALLARCAALRREGPGGVLVKAAKPGQERRADLPAIGPDTVRNAAKAGLRGIAVEADSTLVIAQAAVVEMADKTGLFVTGVTSS